MITPDPLLQKASEIMAIKDMFIQGNANLHKHCMELKEKYYIDNVDSYINEIEKFSASVESFDTTLDALLNMIRKIAQTYENIDADLLKAMSSSTEL